MSAKELYISKLCYYNNNEVKYRQSFNRFCDDLCELIVSYLTFEQKITFESISKQFQRCIYNKQNSIQLNDRYFIGITLNRLLFNNQISGEFNCFAFECLLIKCKFINKISIDSRLEFGDPVIELITKYCNYLKEIKFDFSHISHQCLTQFGLKFGEKLEKIEFLYPELNKEKLHLIKSLLRFCPNLKSINNINVETFGDFETLVPKILRIKNLFLTEDKYTELFVNKYQNSLKSFRTEMTLNYFNDNEVKQNFVLKQLSLLKNLEELQLVFKCFESTIVIIKSIANECKNIKKIYFEVNVKTSVGSQLFESMGYFENLEFLALNGIKGELSIKSLKNCRKLKVLKLGNKEISDQFFDGIETIIPELIDLVFGSFGQISEKTFNSLAKLKKLKSLAINNRRYWPSVTDEVICHFIDNCPQMESIKFRRRPNITQKTIYALIALALRKPRISFNHDLGISYDYFSQYSDSHYSTPEKFIQINQKLPNNLIINF